MRVNDHRPRWEHRAAVVLVVAGLVALGPLCASHPPAPPVPLFPRPTTVTGDHR